MSSARSKRPAVFLDRDGTLNRERDDAPACAADLELLPGVGAAAARLARAGFALVVVTNQSAVARGHLGFAELAEVHGALGARLAAAGAPLDGVYLCPHHPDEGAPPYRRTCACRKPGAGLFARAARELDLDLAASWIVGDAERDLLAGAGAGVRGVLVATGKGRAEHARLAAAGRAPGVLAADLAEAAEHILAAQGR